MTVARRPAAYLRITSGPGGPALARLRDAVTELARQRGWPPPAIYADEGLPDDAHSPALARLSDAIGAGRHDALLLPGPGMIARNPARLMALLYRCTSHGVAVVFFSSAGAAYGSVPRPPATARAPGYAPQVRLPRPARSADVLERAGVEALSMVFSGWRIWSDEHGWHARRRGLAYLQDFGSGAPAFCVHARNPVDLAAQLCWQQAADTHSPAGCSGT